MAGKSKTSPEADADGFGFVDVLPSGGAGRAHVETVEDRIVKALLERGDGVVKFDGGSDVEGTRRRLRYAAFRVDRSARTRVVDGWVYVDLVARRSRK